MLVTIVQLSPKLQMSESRSSTIGLCVIVERPDRHCGDDLVLTAAKAAANDDSRNVLAPSPRADAAIET